MKKLLKFSSISIIIIGSVITIAGIWGMVFTYKNVARENITTPADATIPNTPVRGPFTLKSQVDIIRTHVLRTTGGKTYAEMPSKIPKLDQNRNQVLDEKGETVMVANDTRNIWITATTLITALNLGIISYTISGLAVLLGLISVLIGTALYCIKENK